jgi:aminoglycoside 3-N-acetyltransferase
MAARELSLSGRPVVIHSSLRSFGRVEGGPSTVIEGLLSEGCTVMTPTFSWAFSVVPPAHLRPPRNAADYDSLGPLDSESKGIYRPDSDEYDRESMGAIPGSVLSMQGRCRGNHPLISFTAVGPDADDLIRPQLPLDVWAPLAALTDRRGSIVLMGVNLTTMTFLHFAEKVAGRTPFRRWANGADGMPMMVEAGSCSNGFQNLAGPLASITTEAMVGESRWLVGPAKETLARVVAAIRADPGITRCSKRCGRCKAAMLGGPILNDGR